MNKDPDFFAGNNSRSFSRGSDHPGYQRRQVDQRFINRAPDPLGSSPPHQPPQNITPVTHQPAQPLQQQTVRRQAPGYNRPTTNPRQTKRNSFRARIKSGINKLPLHNTATVLLIVIVFFGSLFAFNTVKGHLRAKAELSEKRSQSRAVEAEDNQQPSEEGSGTPVDQHFVAEDLPRVLSIPKINAEASIFPMGVTALNKIKEPENIYDAGWYTASAKPGQDGTILLNGHIAGPTKPGFLGDITQLNRDDKIKLERGDGQVFTYTVVKTQWYEDNKVDMSSAMNTSIFGKPALNIITGRGRFNEQTNEYEKRAVIYSVLY